jgi:dienelactone hydrolase
MTLLHAVLKFFAPFAAALMLALELLFGGQIAKPPLPDASRFSYDASRNLDVQSRVAEEPDGAIVRDLSYASPRGGRVTAWLVTPSKPGRYAGVLFGHWGGGDRSEFLPEAILYARAGVVSLLPAYPWTRPAPWHRRLRYLEDPVHDLEMYTQTVIDLRRGLDLLWSRPDVDPARVGYVGHSYGAQWGAILAAIDRRMKTAVLVGGVPDLAALYLDTEDPVVAEIRESNRARIDRAIDVQAPLDAIRHVGHAAPIPLLFQFARYEQGFPKSSMDRYYAAARDPKAILWYPTAHDLNDPQALVDRAAWLRKHLDIGPIALPTVPSFR